MEMIRVAGFAIAAAFAAAAVRRCVPKREWRSHWRRA